LHDAVADGALGSIALILAEGIYFRPQGYYDSAAWRGTATLDGGVLMNQAIHVIDLVRWIGGPVRSVAGNVATRTHAMEAEDAATVSLAFESGALGSIVATTCAEAEAPTELRVHGDAGHVRLVGDRAVEWAVPGRAAPAEEVQTGVNGSAPPTAASATWGTTSAGFVRQYTDFRDAIRTGRPPAVTGRDGRNAVEIITAAYESSRSGRAVMLEGVAP
jgi:predicted dehydrogenase